MTAPEHAVFFSGGKDSMLALDRAARQGLRVTRLVTLYNAASGRVRFHGVPVPVMRAQAHALGLPTTLAATTPTTFEAVFLETLTTLRAQGIGALIFGDIHLADVRAWYEDRVRAAGLDHVEPLWGEDPLTLARESVDRGYRAVLTCLEAARTRPEWLGQPLTHTLLDAFVTAGIDPCGERGEYHTLVTDGPRFAHPLPIRLGEIVSRDGFTQIDVQPADFSPASSMSPTSGTDSAR
jgi:uncharacterized protein (TIGR00290 family)